MNHTIKDIRFNSLTATKGLFLCWKWALNRGLLKSPLTMPRYTSPNAPSPSFFSIMIQDAGTSHSSSRRLWAPTLSWKVLPTLLCEGGLNRCNISKSLCKEYKRKIYSIYILYIYIYMYIYTCIYNWYIKIVYGTCYAVQRPVLLVNAQWNAIVQDDMRKNKVHKVKQVRWKCYEWCKHTMPGWAYLHHSWHFHWTFFAWCTLLLCIIFCIIAFHWTLTNKRTVVEQCNVSQGQFIE